MAAERWPGLTSKEVGSRRRSRSKVFAPEGRFPLARGAARSRVAARRRSHVCGVRSLGSGRVRGSEVREEKTSEGRKPKRVSAGGSGATRADVNGLAERIKASKRVKSSERDGDTSGRPGGPGSALRRDERDLIVVGGSRQTRPSGCERLTKPAVIRRSRVRLSTAADNRRGASGPREGCATLCEGKALKESEAQDGCGTKQGRETRVCQEAAERLRKPESGTEVGVTPCLERG